LNIDSIISEAQSVASEFGVRLRIIDITDNIVDLRLYIDVELFIQVYANQLKDKLNLNLIFKNRRLCGYDSEGGRIHIHPIDEPEFHIFTEKKVAIKEFTTKALKLLEEREML
jgi:hypothetical protein